jgi:hypothetical protein
LSWLGSEVSDEAVKEIMRKYEVSNKDAINTTNVTASAQPPQVHSEELSINLSNNATIGQLQSSQ